MDTTTRLTSSARMKERGLNPAKILSYFKRALSPEEEKKLKAKLAGFKNLQPRRRRHESHVSEKYEATRGSAGV